MRERRRGVGETDIGMTVKSLHMLAIIVTAAAMVPGGAHLFALPNKIRLDAEPYFVTQGIYRGWALFGIALVSALMLDGALAFALRRRRTAFVLAVIATVAIAMTLVVFFAWTYPANVATQNWTVIPADWRDLRTQWEYSHAVNAVIDLVAFCCVVAAAFADDRPAAE
jgi:hypothetical protein